MQTKVAVFGTAGVVLTLLAIVSSVVPGAGTLLDPLGAMLAGEDPTRLLLLLGALTGGYAVWTAWRRGSSPDDEDPATARYEAAADEPPEAVGVTDHETPGDGFDRQVEAALAGDSRALQPVQQRLADTATRALTRSQNCSKETARRAVETGEWTDDELAAAFVAGDDGPDYSLWTRLRGWLDPETERRRRVERTVSAVQKTARGDRA
ncbi:DUF7269 family protein [Halorussus halophilus]|uniref:DUF7269 family protein n=1 Tax=Halorussus halophilus TaxID=2650975 RepID=UPI0013011CF6|nr:hypothetical protein [Halorussus halophilus]